MPAITKKEVRTDDAPPPKPSYSQGVVEGNMVYVSGSLGVDPQTGKLVEGTTGDCTTQTLKNMANILGAAGSPLSNLVKVNIFITNMKNYSVMSEAYAKQIFDGVKPLCPPHRLT
ncbi:hypothetical protein ACHAPT_013561 [Fusarium lateritium]